MPRPDTAIDTLGKRIANADEIGSVWFGLNTEDAKALLDHIQELESQVTPEQPDVSAEFRKAADLEAKTDALDVLFCEDGSCEVVERPEDGGPVTITVFADVWETIIDMAEERWPDTDAALAEGDGK